MHRRLQPNGVDRRPEWMGYGMATQHTHGDFRLVHLVDMFISSANATNSEGDFARHRMLTKAAASGKPTAAAAAAVCLSCPYDVVETSFVWLGTRCRFRLRPAFAPFFFIIHQQSRSTPGTGRSVTRNPTSNHPCRPYTAAPYDR